MLTEDDKWLVMKVVVVAATLAAFIYILRYAAEVMHVSK
jgi:hypothetical protein